LPSFARVMISFLVIMDGSGFVSPRVGMYWVVSNPLALSVSRALSQNPREPSSNVRLIIGLLKPGGAASSVSE
jgi:hypothetical protein